jgi:lipopolysaccharide/colanic/teichoic acid biosynthesis glycosyltransferase
MLILLLNGHPIFYQWNVHGFQGKRFSSYKFRTMSKNADSLKNGLERSNEMSDVVFKIKNDPRITNFGKVLRKYSLDELPQLFSVLKGDMSLIGPRPCFPHELNKFKDWHLRKLSVVPGLSCIWQVSGRNKIDSFDEWVKLDLYYIDNWSLVLDIKIFFKTIVTVVKGSGT